MSDRPGAQRRRLTRPLVAVSLSAALSISMAGAISAPAFAASGSASGSSAPSTSVAATGVVGLYGSQDPTYDGVYRQSLAIVSLVAAGQAPDSRAVDWLLAQQCSDGAFTAYRSDPTVACTTSKEDENATAAAIQALVALGKPTSTAIAALKRFQLADGGFYDSAAFGAPASDANSTGLAQSAFVAAGIDSASVTANGKTADDYLRSLQLPCSATEGAGSYDYQTEPTLAANDYATVQATLGELGKAFTVAAGAPTANVPGCVAAIDAATSASNAIGYLAARLTATNGAIPSGFGTGTDWTSTADAVLDLAAAGQGSAAIATGLAALTANARAYTQSGGADLPGPLATLLLVAHATGTDATDFGGLNLTAALTGTERTAAPAPSPTPKPTPSPTASPKANPTASPTANPTLPMTGSNDALPLGLFGALLVLVGAAAVAVGRRRGQPVSVTADPNRRGERS